jgi:hypothetical protein
MASSWHKKTHTIGNVATSPPLVMSAEVPPRDMDPPSSDARACPVSWPTLKVATISQVDKHRPPGDMYPPSRDARACRGGGVASLAILAVVFVLCYSYMEAKIANSTPNVAPSSQKYSEFAGPRDMDPPSRDARAYRKKQREISRKFRYF